MPSLHFGYALIVGGALEMLTRHPVVRLLGLACPLVMLFVIVATGSHFLLDAAAGGLVVVAGRLVAARCSETRGHARRRAARASPQRRRARRALEYG